VHALVIAGPRRHSRGREAVWAGLAAAACLACASIGCKERVSRSQCDELLVRFAGLVVKEKHPNASPEAIKAEEQREREEAARDDSFKNCTTELRADEYRCAMGATTAEGLLKCLE
jgi:hypothetical protein